MSPGRAASRPGPRKETHESLAAQPGVEGEARSRRGALPRSGLGTEITADAADLTAATDDGLGFLRVARFTFDPTADTAMRTAAAHGLGVTLPDNAIVLGGGVEMLTTSTSTAGGADKATIALHIKDANDLITATAIESATFWDAVAYKVVVPTALRLVTAIKLAQRCEHRHRRRRLRCPHRLQPPDRRLRPTHRRRRHHGERKTPIVQEDPRAPSAP